MLQEEESRHGGSAEFKRSMMMDSVIIFSNFLVCLMCDICETVATLVNLYKVPRLS